MTKEQMKYRNFLMTVFEDENYDITRTLVWVQLHWPRIPKDVWFAYKQLNSAQRNQVVAEICKVGEVQ